MVDEREIITPKIARLYDFLDGLQANGFKIDPRKYMALSDLLITLIARGETLENLNLKTLLAPIICTSPTEQQDFYSRFDHWSGDLINSSQRENTTSKGRIKSQNKFRRNKYVQTFILSLSAIFLTLLIFTWLNSNGSFDNYTKWNDLYTVLILFSLGYPFLIVLKAIHVPMSGRRI